MLQCVFNFNPVQFRENPHFDAKNIGLEVVADGFLICLFIFLKHSIFM